MTPEPSFWGQIAGEFAFIAAVVAVTFLWRTAVSRLESRRRRIPPRSQP